MTGRMTRRSWLTTLVVLGLCCVPAVAWAALGSYVYVGNYRAGLKRGTVDFQIVERHQSGIYLGWVTVDGVSYLASFVVGTDTVDAEWSVTGPTGGLVPIGYIQGTISPDGQSITGPFKHRYRRGTCKLRPA